MLNLYNIKIDFKKDFVDILRSRLKLEGYDTSKINDKDICFSYFNLKKRLISTKVRKIKIANEFKCPKFLNEGLKLLKEKIKNGENINSYLSKRILDLDYNDDLLNDWGIYHLHLGDKIEKNTKFINRTGPLLFVRFYEEYAYFINVYNHGAWTNQQMIRILHNNWPESIEQYRLKDIESIFPKPTDKEYLMLRKSHISTLVEVEKGVIYFPIGMGYMSSGHSTEVIRLCDYHSRIINKYEEYVKNNVVDIINKIKNCGGIILDKFYFRLWLEDDKVFAYEVYSGSKIEL